MLGLVKSVSTSPPKLFKPRGIGGGIPYRVLNIPVSKIVLDQARVRALVGQSEAAGVAQHVGVRLNGQLGQLAIAPHGDPRRAPIERCPSL